MPERISPQSDGKGRDSGEGGKPQRLSGLHKKVAVPWIAKKSPERSRCNLCGRSRGSFSRKAKN